MGDTSSMSTPGTEAKLLVVDDEPNIRDLLASSLRFAGFDVVTAEDGSGAFHEAQASRPDLIVLDVMLPDMDGFTVTRRLRDAGTTTPVLFLTARDDMRDKIQGLTVPHRVQAPALPRHQRWARRLQDADPRPRVGIRLGR